MGYYLQLDGVDDKVALNGPSTPDLTEAELDFLLDAREDWHQIINLSGKALNFNGSTSNVTIATDYAAVYVNGVLVVTNTPFVPIGQRIILRVVLKTGITTGTNHSFFLNNSISQFLAGRVYGIRIYKNGALIRNFDLTTGSVLDQLGSGVSLQLIGGTWVQDTPASVDVSYTYSTRQVITANRAVIVATAQTIAANRLTSVPTIQNVSAQRQQAIFTRQTVSVTRTTAMPTLQAIMALRIISAETCQKITAQKGQMVATRLEIVVTRAIPASTRQIISVRREWSYPILIEIVDPDSVGTSIVAVVPLIGQRLLTATLDGNRLLTVPLEGRVVMAVTVNLKMRQGESRQHPITLTDQDGSPLKLQGCTITLRVHKRHQVPSYDLVKSVQIINPETGEAYAELVPEDTARRGKGVHSFEIWVEDAAGHENPVIDGSLTIV